MKYNFDQVIERHGTGSVKWEFIIHKNHFDHWDETHPSRGNERVLPLWVADMDFLCPQPVVDALVARAQHGIYGYTVAWNDYYEAVMHWMQKRHGWQVQREWITSCPGVVPALNLLVRTFVRPGEKVLIQRPVYYPFTSSAENNGAVVVSNSLVYKDGGYRMDFDDLEAKASDPQVKMAILCHPHNPVGRVWTKDELLRFGEICLERNILVASDEIHGDLVRKDVCFIPFASLSEEFSQHSVTCTAPSKTFNVAGLHTSNIIIPNPELRDAFRKTLRATGLGGINPFGMEALIAAYREGEDWLEQVLDYIWDNYEYMKDFITHHLSQVTILPLEGTYLAWLDFRALGLNKDELEHLMLEEARVYLDQGYIFGPEGEGFERINIACPRAILVEAMERIRRAVKQMK